MTVKQLTVVAMAEDNAGVVILDETELPNREIYRTLTTREQMWEAVKKLRVRGAPALGVFAGYALAALAWQHQDQQKDDLLRTLKDDADYLNSARPTAVNLGWALKRMVKAAQQSTAAQSAAIAKRLVEEAHLIDEENIAMNRRIAEYGVTLLKDGDGVLTHCNAGYLACLGYGTATAPMYMAQEKGMHIHVYSDETRPLLQGGRLTTYELYKAGIDVTAICDNMASLVMKQGKIQCVMVGCDRIAANGDFANKIGTSGVAVLARYYGIPFYTLGPSSTIDLDTPTGDDIPIEMRDPEEIGTMWYKEPMILPEIPKYNPSFDVTDHSLLSAIVTEKGIVYPPFDVNLRKLFADKEKKG